MANRPQASGGKVWQVQHDQERYHTSIQAKYDPQAKGRLTAGRKRRGMVDGTYENVCEIARGRFLLRQPHAMEYRSRFVIGHFEGKSLD